MVPTTAINARTGTPVSQGNPQATLKGVDVHAVEVIDANVDKTVQAGP
jgi:hypothetical protein